METNVFKPQTCYLQDISIVKKSEICTDPQKLDQNLMIVGRYR